MHREQRLRRGVDFERVRAGRKSWAHPLLVCYERSREGSGPTRVGIVVGRRVGKAAARNRVKRRIREAMRALYPQLSPGYDLIVIARQPAAVADLGQLAIALESIVARMAVGKALRDASVVSPDATRSSMHEDAR